jgi:hypothetical protein
MRLLLVAMCDSVHTARWIAQLEGSKYSLVLFPSTPHRRIHPVIDQMLRGNQSKFVEMRRFDRYLAFPLGLMDLMTARYIQGWRLRRLLKNTHFDAVHLLETQHAGYLYRRAMAKSPHSLPVALSVWGSDFAWFMQKPRHRKRIQGILAFVTFLFVECKRDVLLARRLGYSGEYSRPIPASGGVGELSALTASSDLQRPSLRNSIVVKGYTGFVGQASASIRAVVHNATHLRGFKIHVYSCSLWMMVKLKLVCKQTGLDIRAYRKKSLSHAEVLAIFREARVSLSLSLCDGLPGSFREAVWTGAYPIESIGSCVNEWASDGHQVRLVDPKNLQDVIDALHEALTDSNVVDRAWQSNTALATQLSTETTVSNVLTEYERVLSSNSQAKSVNIGCS